MASQATPASPNPLPDEPPSPEDENNLDMRTEPLGLYGPGSLCPIHLGDLLKDARYRILRKLGYGVYSTVWLAFDQELSRYVAVKIATAESDFAGQELKILRHISTELQQYPGRSHVLALFDSFEHKGPNGTHECFVFEVMGSSLEAYVMDSRLKIQRPGFPSTRPQNKFKYNLLEVKSILRQILQGIDFLHKCGIVHGDLQKGNVLMSIKDLSSIEESHLAQYDEDSAHFVAAGDSDVSRFVRTYKDEGPSITAESESPCTKRQKTSHNWENSMPTQEFLQDEHKQHYIALLRPLDDVVEFASPIQIKICDMGGAFFLSSPPENPITPLNMRSPELILGHPITQKQDIWSFGCLVYELITSSFLFTVFSSDYKKWMMERSNEDEEEEEDHVTENEVGETDSINYENGSKLQTNREEEVDEGSNTEQQESNDTKKEDNKTQNPAAITTHSQDDEGEMDDHLQQLACVLRPLPPSILSQWPKASQFCDPQTGESKYDEGDDVPPYQSLEEIFDYEKPIEVNAAERVAALDLIRYILQYKPEKRPSAEQLLKHPWFKEADVLDGGEECVRV